MTNVGHDSQIDSRHPVNDMEQGGQKSGNAKRVYVKVKNEYDASS
jgi:hypothetical protein